MSRAVVNSVSLPRISLQQSLTIYRVCKLRFADLTGIGASRDGARWNKPGQRAIYTSLELSNAFVESFSHLARNSIPEPLGRMYIELDLRDYYSTEYITNVDTATGLASTTRFSTEPTTAGEKATMAYGSQGSEFVLTTNTATKPLITIFNNIEVATHYYKMLEGFTRETAVIVPSAINPVYNLVLFPEARHFKRLVKVSKVEEHEIHPSLLELLTR